MRYNYIIIISPFVFKKGSIYMSKNAIYARKSVYREDSISVKSQIEKCEYELKGEDYIAYTDNGFSGKNTDRPDFQKLMNDIRMGKVKKVIVYKLDRISRSVLDFAEMLQVFQSYNVDFISATEHFDTTSPIGKAMLNISMVFAQMERETIQQRVTDAYLSRSKRGFYMGGRIPLGYNKIPISVDGIKTAMYEQNPEQAEIVRFIFNMYSQPNVSLRDIVRMLNEREMFVKGKAAWNATHLWKIIKNPSYTYADLNVYHFYKRQNISIINEPDEFIGQTSMYLFSGKANEDGKYLVIAPHIPLVDSKTWLACNAKSYEHKEVRITKPKISVFSGKVKCGYCGYGINTRENQKGARYLYCLGKIQYQLCKVDFPTMHGEPFEETVMSRIREKLESLTIRKDKEQSQKVIAKSDELKLKLEKVNGQIESLIDKMIGATDITVQYVNKKLEVLDTEKKEIEMQIEEIHYKQMQTSNDVTVITDAFSKWDSLSFDDKRKVVDLIIKKITLYLDRIEIEWKV